MAWSPPKTAVTRHSMDDRSSAFTCNNTRGHTNKQTRRNAPCRNPLLHFGNACHKSEKSQYASNPLPTSLTRPLPAGAQIILGGFTVKPAPHPKLFLKVKVEPPRAHASPRHIFPRSDAPLEFSDPSSSAFLSWPLSSVNADLTWCGPMPKVDTSPSLQVLISAIASHTSGFYQPLSFVRSFVLFGTHDQALAAILVHMFPYKGSPVSAG